MQCPKCQTALPDDARFCGMCGMKFAPAAAAPPPAAEEVPQFENPKTGEKVVRFFDDNSGQTDVAHVASLKAIADLAMEGKPIPGSGASNAPVPTVSQEMPVMKEAAPAPVKEKNVDPVTRQPFEFRKEDLAKALARAAQAAGKPVPDKEPGDLTAYYAAGEAAGIPRKGMEEALHKTALERMDQPRRKPSDMDAPLTSELQSIQPSGKKYVLAGVGVLVVLIIIGVVSSVMGGGGETGAGGTESASGGQAAPGDTGKQGGDKPKRHAGEMDKNAIAPAIEGVAKKARTCHEAARKANPKVAGKLVFDVEMEEDGTFSKLAVKEDTVNDARMVECVKKEVQSYPWPHPKGGFFAMEFPLGFEVAEQGKTPPPAAGKKGHKH